MDAVALLFVLTLAFVVGSLRKRIGTLESMVLRLQGRLDDTDGHRPTAPKGDPASPIDIEPFID
jgi:hypothetical protein